MLYPLDSGHNLLTPRLNTSLQLLHNELYDQFMSITFEKFFPRGIKTNFVNWAKQNKSPS